MAIWMEARVTEVARVSAMFSRSWRDTGFARARRMRSTMLRRGRKTKPFRSSLHFTISGRSSGLAQNRDVVGRRSGDALRLVAVTVETAEELCRAEERRLAEITARLEPVPGRSRIDLRSLYNGNLISGVVKRPRLGPP
jgi:hypothetical protein